VITGGAGILGSALVRRFGKAEAKLSKIAIYSVFLFSINIFFMLFFKQFSFNF